MATCVSSNPLLCGDSWAIPIWGKFLRVRRGRAPPALPDARACAQAASVPYHPPGRPRGARRRRGPSQHTPTRVLQAAAVARQVVAHATRVCAAGLQLPACLSRRLLLGSLRGIPVIYGCVCKRAAGSGACMTLGVRLWGCSDLAPAAPVRAALAVETRLAVAGCASHTRWARR
jgi:hypothetical protein